MISVNSSNLWDKLSILAKESESKKAAVAYLTDDSLISFSEGDVLIIDASEEAITSGKTSAKILENAFKNGTELYSCNTLHAKTIVFDHHAYIGSANISLNSVNNLDELGVISDHPSFVSGALQFIEQLKTTSIKVDSIYIDKILKIEPATVKPLKKPTKTKVPIVINQPKCWLISLRNDASYPGNESLVLADNRNIEVIENEEASWFWLKEGAAPFEKAKIGDSVVIIEREHTKVDAPECAYRHITIKDITIDDTYKVKAYHYAYSDSYRITWSNFKKLAPQAGINNLGSGLRTIRELSERQSNLLFELWSPNV